MEKLHINYKIAVDHLLATRKRELQAARKTAKEINQKASNVVHCLITMVIHDERTTGQDLYILQRLRSIFDSQVINATGEPTIYRG